MIDNYTIEELNTVTFNKVTKNRKQPIVMKVNIGDEKKFNFDQLSMIDEDIMVNVRVYGTDRKVTPRDQWTSFCEFTQMRFSNYLAKVNSGVAESEGLYLALFEVGNTKLAKLFRSTLNSISDSSPLLSQETNDINLWVSPPNHLEPLHFDGDDGTLIQFSGRKKVTLIDPKYSKKLYPFPWWRGGMPSTFSRVDIYNPDIHKYPNAPIALKNALSIELHPGMALFIPAGWWHQVEAVPGFTNIVSVNRFWYTRHIGKLLFQPRLAFTIYSMKIIFFILKIKSYFEKNK